MSEVIVDTLKHSGNSSTANLTLASTGNVTVGADLIATKQNGCERIILEKFLTPCDGSTIATANGNITVSNVSSTQTMSTTHTDITGSSISYTPPTGATQVIYEFHTCVTKGDDQYHWTHFKYLLDDVDVAYAHNSIRVDAGGEDGPGRPVFIWAFNIGGTANANTGRVASWTSAKTIKMQARSYNDGNEAGLHKIHGWDGSSNSGNGYFSMPLIGITAIG